MNPSPVTSEEIELTIVRDDQKPVKRGAPLRLTKRRFLKVCHGIERGLSASKSCELEGITYQIFRLRVSRSPRLQERLKSAETVRFNRRHEEALASIMEAGHKSFIAHCWWLERCLPELYALRKVERTVAEQVAGEQQVRVIGLPASELDKMVGPEYKRLENGNVTREVGGIKVIYAVIAA